MGIGQVKIISFVVLLFVVVLSAQARVIKGILGRGEAAVVGITAEEGQFLALQRARADAIEQAAGIKLLGSTLVCNNMLAGDFIKTFTRGFIIAEEIKWLPLEQFQSDPKIPPIPMYLVQIKADVNVPQKNNPPISLQASLNKQIFASGEHAVIKITTSEDAYVAVFNIRADDKIEMLYPNNYTTAQVIYANKNFLFPSADSGVILKMFPLKKHKQDTEAFLIAASHVKEKISPFTKHFQCEKLYSVPEFFKLYADIANSLTEIILSYNVHK